MKIQHILNRETLSKFMPSTRVISTAIIILGSFNLTAARGFLEAPDGSTEIRRSADIMGHGMAGSEQGMTEETGPMDGMQGEMEGSCKITSKKSGKWSDKDSWNQGIPSFGDHVCIQMNHSIVFDLEQKFTDGVSTLELHGELNFSQGKNTQLFVETITIHPSGSLKIGSQKKPLPDSVKARIIFHTDGQLNPSSEMFPHQLGLINNGGTLVLHGKQVSRILKANSPLEKDSNSINLDSNSHGWARGDLVLIPSTTFTRDQAPANKMRLITGVSGQSITLNKPLDSSVKLPLNERPIIANLSSNIILSSNQPGKHQRRGHVMVMPDESGSCGNVKIKGVRFKNLGRTNKSNVTSTTNQKMMYPLHFHHCGLENQYRVTNNVAIGSPGWVFVNHRSNVVFRNNVAFKFTGAGFVTEGGNELGSFENNLAVGGKGIVDSKGSPVFPFRRLYIKGAAAKERLRAADLGFHGDGFWMSSPFVDVKNNIAAGNSGAGFVWYSLGLDDVHVNDRESGKFRAGSFTFNELPGFAKKQMKHSTPKRYYKSYGSKYFIQQDLPVFGKIARNTAYGNYVGLRIRYLSNTNLVAAAKFFGTDQAKQFITDLSKNRMEILIHDSYITDMILLNNEIGLHSTYSSRVNYTNLTIASNQYNLNSYYQNSAEFIKLNAPTGLEMNHSSNNKHSIKGLNISGYPICMRINPKSVTVEDKKLEGCAAKQGTDYKEFVLDQEEVRKIRI